jgi:hypothetical protein
MGVISTASRPVHISRLICAPAAPVIGFSATRLSRPAAILADATGPDETFMVSVYSGASASLHGIKVSVTAASQGHASLTLSNAFKWIRIYWIDSIYRVTSQATVIV